MKQNKINQHLTKLLTTFIHLLEEEQSITRNAHYNTICELDFFLEL